MIKTDRAGKRLRSAVIAFRASCDDGESYAFSAAVTATRPAPGIEPGQEDLVMRLNRAGRFAGTVMAEVVVVGADTGEQVAVCSTGTVRWKASRDAGRIYAGATAQDEPVVARLDNRRRRLMSVYVASRARDCNPQMVVRLPGNFGTFRVDRRGRWGDDWAEVEAFDDGTMAFLTYELRGTLGRTVLRGTVSVDVERRDAAGAVDLTCRSGTIAWRATTG